MGALFSTSYCAHILFEMKFLVIFTIFLVIAGHYQASSLDSDALKKAGANAICTKNCEKTNKQIKKIFDKKCPEQVCKNEKVKENIFKQFDKRVETVLKKKLGCEEVCVKTFAGEEEHDHDH